MDQLIKRPASFFWQIFGHKSWVPLVAIFLAGLDQIYFLIQLKNAPVNITHITTFWVGLQFVFSTLFGLISDKFCRKKVLIFSLACSIFSIPILNMGWAWSAIFLNGAFGNIAPIARAAYCDIQIQKNKESNIINTFLILPLPYIVLSFNYHLFETYSYFFMWIAEVFVLCTTIFFFQDRRDKENRDVSIQFLNKLKQKFFTSSSLRLLLAFYILNSGWWLLTYRAEDQLDVHNLLKYFFLIVGLAFLTGAIICRIYTFKPEKALPLIFLFITILFVFDYLFSIIIGGINIDSSFMHFTLLGGVGLPLCYVFYSSQATPHEQGTVFGLMESVRALTELSGPVILSLISIQGVYLFLVPQSIVGLLLVISLKTRRLKYL